MLVGGRELLEALQKLRGRGYDAGAAATSSATAAAETAASASGGRAEDVFAGRVVGDVGPEFGGGRLGGD